MQLGIGDLRCRTSSCVAECAVQRDTIFARHDGAKNEKGWMVQTGSFKFAFNFPMIISFWRTTMSLNLIVSRVLVLGFRD